MMRGLDDVALAGRRVMLRVDLNLPMTDDGRIADLTRLHAVLPTVRRIQSTGAALLLVSHFGRPPEGAVDPRCSLRPVAERLGVALGYPLPLLSDWALAQRLPPGETAMLENVRFLAGEKANDPALAQRLAALCDVFVLDAFAVAHRAHASVCGVATHARTACAGPLLQAELQALERVTASPQRPWVAVIGGGKLRSKLAALRALAGVVDHLVVGGGVANTFLAAAGFPPGRSLHEPGFLPQAQALLSAGSIVLPEDVAVSGAGPPRVCAPDDLAETEAIMDIGPRTVRRIATLLSTAKTVLWCGPMGAYEREPFGRGSEGVARALADSAAFSLIGGGDTLAVAARAATLDGMSYISTGGGALLTAVAGEALPGVDALRRHAD